MAARGGSTIGQLLSGRAHPHPQQVDVSSGLREEDRIQDEKLRATIPKGNAMMKKLEADIKNAKANGDEAPWLSKTTQMEVQAHQRCLALGIDKWKLELRVMDCSKQNAGLMHKRQWSVNIESRQRDIQQAEELQSRATKILKDCQGN